MRRKTKRLPAKKGNAMKQINDSSIVSPHHYENLVYPITLSKTFLVNFMVLPSARRPEFTVTADAGVVAANMLVDATCREGKNSNETRQTLVMCWAHVQL